MGSTCTKLTATLLRRVAHAVDGIRTGQEVYVVVDQEPPYRVTLITENEQEAEEEAASSESLCYCGPFATACEDGPAFLIYCHEPDSDWCDDVYVTRGTFNPPRKMPGNEHHTLPKDTDVEQITVEWKLRNGTKNRTTFRWRRLPSEPNTVNHMVDALFFTQAAIDKFVLPYITSVQTSKTGFEVSERLRNGIVAIQRGQTGNGQRRMIRLSNMNMIARLVPAETEEGKQA